MLSSAVGTQIIHEVNELASPSVSRSRMLDLEQDSAARFGSHSTLPHVHMNSPIQNKSDSKYSVGTPDMPSRQCSHREFIS